MSDRHQIIVVGGGAGGLELVTALGNKLGRHKRADVTLIDSSRTHVWKPLLHEVAAGTLDSHEDELEYMAQARWHHFRFRLGRMLALDREQRTVTLAATHNDAGEEVVPERTFRYDTLVIAVGSLSNDFGIPGVKEHCLFLDTTGQAERFQRRLLDSMLRAHTLGQPIRAGQLDVAIVGAGATGVELAAQLHHVTRQLSAYGLDTIDPERHIKLHIIEAAPRILAALPPRLSAAATAELARLGVVVHTNERVVEVTAEGIRTASGHFIPANFKVWAAGIKAPDFLREIAGLETNDLNQLVVRPTLQTTRDEHIFAIGDCAACALDDQGTLVPPRAQAAHQQASLVAKAVLRQMKGRPLRSYHYRDYGSLVTLGKYSTVGNLMGNLTGSLMITGFIARMVYLSLYKMHQVALHGLVRTGLLTLAHFLRRSVNPQVKLH